jgi:hypothetical protein
MTRTSEEQRRAAAWARKIMRRLKGDPEAAKLIADIVEMLASRSLNCLVAVQFD